MRLLAPSLALWAGAAAAQGLDLTEAERAAFGVEIRALLLDEPDLVGRALEVRQPNAAQIYRDAIDSDLALIESHAGALFTADGATLLGPTGAVAFTSFADPDSPTAAMLADFAQAHGLTIALRDPASHGALMAELGLDIVPSHVFPTLMVRGDVPAVVLERYLR